MRNENFFVARRKMQKAELDRIVEGNKDLTRDQVIVIFAKRTGLKHSTIAMMLDEVMLEREI